MSFAKRVREELKADVSTDLKLRFALQRRSLAFDQARLVDYDRFEKWTQILLEAYTASPPECYKKVSIEQVQHADIEMFKYLMKETRNGIRFNGQLNPLEEAIRRALTAPEIRLHLQPLPSSSGSAQSGRVTMMEASGRNLQHLVWILSLLMSLDCSDKWQICRVASATCPKVVVAAAEEAEVGAARTTLQSKCHMSY